MASGLPSQDPELFRSEENVSIKQNDPEKKKDCKNVVLLIGNEGFGIASELSRFCDSTICLGSNRKLHPMVDSLNVSVASALIIQFLKNKYLKLIF